MYARRLANEIIARPGEEPDERYDARPTHPASTNARALRAWEALSKTTTTTARGGTSRAGADDGVDASVVLRGMAVMPSEETIAARRRPRLDPWTTRALRDDDDGDGGERSADEAGEKGGVEIDGEEEIGQSDGVGGVGEIAGGGEEGVGVDEGGDATQSRGRTRGSWRRGNFAGKMVEVETEFVEGTKEAKAHTKRVEMLAKGGIDAVLAELMQPKKLTVMDKTKADWRNVKDGDSELQEDLQHHQRGGRTYREQQDFLQQADFREYELERDARLAANSKRGAAR